MSNITCSPNPTEQSVLNRSSKDKFILVFALPIVLKRANPNDKILKDMDSIQISVFGSIVPDVSVPAVAAPYGGQVYNVSSHSRPNYAPLTINFMVDNNYTNYYVLWKWLAALNHPKDSTYAGLDGKNPFQSADIYETGTLKDYQANFSILALNEYNEIVTEFKYYNAFITSLKGISYSYKDAELMETSAEFQFSQFDVEQKNEKQVL
jgi:hypothetical protein